MERYGTIPQKWTKEWWDYIWYYYKWRFLGIVLVVFFTGFTVMECVTQKKYDITITYAGNMVFSDTNIEKIRSQLEPVLEDINGDSKADMLFQQMSFKDTAGSAEYDSAMQIKLDAELQTGNSYLLLVSREIADNWLNRDTGGTEVFVPAEEWLSEEIPDECRLMRNGKTYAVKVSGAPFFESAGVVHDDLYMMVRPLYDIHKDKPKKAENYRISVKAANEIVKGM